MTLLTPTSVHVGPDHPPLDLAKPAHTCPSCALHATGARLSRQLLQLAETREERQRQEIGRLEADNAQLRAAAQPTYEPAKSNRTFGGVA